MHLTLRYQQHTTGLDPQTRKNIWNTIRQLQIKTGMTVFLTTHYMEEAAESDYVIVIDHGRIAAKGTPGELKTKYAADSLRLSVNDINPVLQVLRELNLEFDMSSSELIVKLPDTIAAVPVLERCKKFIKSFEVLQGTMDDAFIGITGKELRQ